MATGNVKFLEEIINDEKNCWHWIPLQRKRGACCVGVSTNFLPDRDLLSLWLSWIISLFAQPVMDYRPTRFLFLGFPTLVGLGVYSRRGARETDRQTDRQITHTCTHTHTHTRHTHTKIQTYTYTLILTILCNSCCKDNFSM